MELDKNIVNKVKEYLDIKDDIAPKDLLDLLYTYRIKFHPDKYEHDQELKKTVEEKFKDIGILIDDLVSFIDRTNILDAPKDIAIYKKPEDASTKYLMELHHKEKEIERLKSKIETLDYRLKGTNEEIDRLRDKKVEERTKELLDMYKPTRKGLLSYGILFIIGLIGTILTKIDSISSTIYKYWFFSEQSFKVIVLLVFFSIPILYIIRLLKEKYIENLSRLITTSSFINKFLIYLQNKEFQKYFTDLHVYEFLENELLPKNKLFLFIRKSLFKSIDEISLERIKDIFIHNLLIKKYIVPSETDKLAQGFKIKEKVVIVISHSNKILRRPTHGIVHAGFSGLRVLVARKKGRCKLIGNSFVIPHDTIPSNVTGKHKLTASHLLANLNDNENEIFGEVLKQFCSHGRRSGTY